MAAAGVPDHLVKALGGWSSDSYLRYIVPSEANKRRAICSVAKSESLFGGVQVGVSETKPTWLGASVWESDLSNLKSGSDWEEMATWK